MHAIDDSCTYLCVKAWRFMKRLGIEIPTELIGFARKAITKGIGIKDINKEISIVAKSMQEPKINTIEDMNKLFE